MQRTIPNGSLIASTLAIALWTHAASAVELETVTVSGKRIDRYSTDLSTASGKLEASLMDLPLTQQSISRELIDDRGLQRFDEAVDTVAGVRRANGFPQATGYFVRGFFEGYGVLRDGFRDINYGGTDLIAVERIEVLKGPSSVLYSGNLSAGGTLNIISRQPAQTPGTDLLLSGGSDEYLRAAIDTSGALSEDADSLRYRVGMAYGRNGDFRDSIDRSQFDIAPSLIWRPTERDTLLVRAEYITSNFVVPADFPMSEVVLQLPIDRYLLEPGLGGSHTSNARLALEYRHEFASEWALRLAANASHVNIDFGFDRLFYPFLDADGRTLPRPLSAGPQKTRNHEVQAELYREFSTGAWQHSFVAGVGAFEEIYGTHNYFSELPPIDIFAPQYGATPGPAVLTFNNENATEALGVFVQDLVDIGHGFKLLGALRSDRMTSTLDNFINSTHTETTDNVLTYRGGVVYQPSERTSFYASTSSSYTPNIYYRSADGSILDPTTGRQWEVGVKQELAQQRLFASAAVFEIRREDVPVVDLNTPGTYVNAGEQRSRGVELELQGSITPQFSLVASYSYIDAEVISDPSLPVGDRLAGVPKHSASAWSAYEIPLDGFSLGLGLGAYYSSKVEASLPNSFQLDSYVRWDGLAYIALASGTRVALNLKNLSDERYYDTDGGYTLRPNAPRSFVLTVTQSF